MIRCYDVVSILVTIVALCLCSVSAIGAGSERKALIYREKARLDKVDEWTRERKVSPVLAFHKKYEPIAEANKKQGKENAAKAAELKDRGDTVLKQDQSRTGKSKAERYYKAAKVFAYYAKQNRRMVEAFESGDVGEMNLAFLEIKKVEKTIKRLIGRPVQRNWLMPQEVMEAFETYEKSSRASGRR